MARPTTTTETAAPSLEIPAVEPETPATELAAEPVAEVQPEVTPEPEAHSGPYQPSADELRAALQPAQSAEERLTSLLDRFDAAVQKLESKTK